MGNHDLPMSSPMKQSETCNQMMFYPGSWGQSSNLSIYYSSYIYYSNMHAHSMVEYSVLFPFVYLCACLYVNQSVNQQRY